MGNAPQIREGDEASFLSHPGRIADKEKDAGGGFCVKSPLPSHPKTGWDRYRMPIQQQCAPDKGRRRNVIPSHLGRIVDRESANRYTPIGFGERYGEPAFDFKRRFPIKSP